MRHESLNALLREGRVVTGAYLAVEPGTEPALYADLHERPRVLGLVAILVQAFESELYRLPLLLTAENYAMGAAVVVASARLSGLLVWRQLGRLDLVAVLKTRE